MKIDEKELAKFLEENPNAKYREIAERFNCSHQWAHVIAIKHGLKKRTKPRHNISDEEIRKYVDANPKKTCQEIADHFETNRQYIIRRARKINPNYFPELRRRIDYEKLTDYALKHKGTRIGEIADHLGFADSTVSEALIKLGLHEKQKRIIDDKEFAKAMEEHPYATIKELAEMFGCSRAAISKAKYRIRNPKEKKDAKAPKKVAWEEYEKILKENPNITKVELSRRLGVGTSTIGRMLRKHGALRGHIQRVDKDKMMEMLKRGNGVEKVAEYFGVTRSAIWGTLARMGIRYREIQPANGKV